MKILIYRYNSICEPDVIDAFKKLGHLVSEIRDEISRKDITPRETIGIMDRALQKDNYDFVFTINFYPAISEVCNIYKIPYVCWSVDSPVLELYAKSMTNDYNRVFLFDYGQYQELMPLNPKRIFHLPLATNVASKDEVITKAKEADNRKFQSDISFVGSMYSEKCPYDRVSGLSERTRGFLEGVLNAQLKVYGYFFMDEVLNDDVVKEFKEHMPDFYTLPEGSYLADKITMSQYYMGNKVTAMERFQNIKMISETFGIDVYTGSDTSNLPKVNNKGFANPLTEMPVIFNQSKININMTSKTIRYGIPQRVWDVLGSGGFLISNYQMEIPEFLVPGEDLVTYGSLEELRHLIAYYLEHEDERAQIALNGYNKVKEFHTYKVRIAQMIEIAFS